jgi:proteasome lid subunit RPN8/RPN11
MIAHAQAEAPNECCGLLAGQPGDIELIATHRFPLVNAAVNPTRRFESSPNSMFAATRAIRSLNVEIIAVYHSHPTGGDQPSATDQEWNYSPNIANIIVDLSPPTPVVSAWWISDRGIKPCELIQDSNGD